MESPKNQLVFEKDGKSAWIRFANGRESFSFESKKEAINGIKDCYKQKKISKDEMMQFLGKIFIASSLEVDINSPGATLEIVISIEIPEVVKSPYFKMCDPKTKIPYGYFYNGNGEILSFPIMYQVQGQEITKLFYNLGKIDSRTCAQLNTMMEIYKLPLRPVEPWEN